MKVSSKTEGKSVSIKFEQIMDLELVEVILGVKIHKKGDIIS